MVHLLFCSLFLMFQEPEAEFLEELSVDFVTLDIVARDRKGNLVTDLTLNDFVVKEDRKKVTPTTFNTLDFRFDIKPQQAEDLTITTKFQRWDKPPEQVPQYIFVLDTQSGNLREARLAINQLGRFLDDLKPGGTVAMQLHGLTYGPISQKWESDPAMIRRDLEKLEAMFLGRFSGSEGTGGLLDSGEKVEKTRAGPNNRDLEELESAFQFCDQLGMRKGNPEYIKCLAEALDSFIINQQERTISAIENLHTLARSFKESTGLKTMILVSPGFSLVPGRAGLQLFDTYLGKIDISDGMNPADTFTLRSYEHQFNRVIHACIANRVIFHTLDIHNFNKAFERQGNLGLGTGARRITNNYKNYTAELNHGLEQLADQSGGRFIRGVNVAAPMNRIITRPPFVYTLAWESPEGKSGKFRKIKVKCKRKGVRLSYRKGYFAR